MDAKISWKDWIPMALFIAAFLMFVLFFDRDKRLDQTVAVA